MLTVTHTALDRQEFESWVKTANPGEVCLYHTGLLMADRIDGLEALKVNDIANCTNRSWRDGFVDLVQQKPPDGKYQYLAVRSSKPTASQAAAAPVVPAEAA